MWGTFQQSTIRIEVEAKADRIRDCLLDPSLLKQWVWPQSFDPTFSLPLQLGRTFDSSLGPLIFHHQVTELDETFLRLVLWGAADGFSDWLWGHGWVQLRIEAVSLVPLGLGQTLLLKQLQSFVQQKSSRQT
jgi:hypothetical protein